MLGGTNSRGVAAPVDMVIFESNEYALPELGQAWGWQAELAPALWAPLPGPFFLGPAPYAPNPQSHTKHRASNIEPLHS
jgi:hypothetical protein